MTQRVVITGAGVLSPLGDSPTELHRSLCAGRSALAPVTSFATDALPNVEAAELTAFDASHYIDGNLRPLDRVSTLSTAAATLALADAGQVAGAEAEIGLVLGTMFGSIHTISEFDRRGLVAGPAYVKPLVFANTVINAAAGQTAIRLGLHGTNSTIAGGAVSGLQALGYARDFVAGGRAGALLAGGCEELSFEAMLGLRRSARLAGSAETAPHAVPFDRDRNGFSLGEGAALLVLEPEAAARARGARVLGSLVGFGQAFDPGGGADVDAAADALRRAIGLALAEADLAATDIGCVFASANGSRNGDLCEGRALLAALEGHRPPVSAIKSMTGEGLGGSGAVQALAALEALRHGQVAGIHRLGAPEPELAALDLSALVRSPLAPTALVTALGFDGAAAALLLTAEDD